MSFPQAFKPKLSQWEEKRAQCLFEHKISGLDKSKAEEDQLESIEEEGQKQEESHDRMLSVSEENEESFSKGGEESILASAEEIEEIHVTEIEEDDSEKEHLQEKQFVEEDAYEESAKEEEIYEEDDFEEIPDFSEITLNSRYLRGQDWEEKLKTNCPYSSPISNKEAPKDLPTHFAQYQQGTLESKLNAMQSSSDINEEILKGKERPAENKDLVDIEKNYLKGVSLKKKEIEKEEVVSRLTIDAEVSNKINAATKKRKMSEPVEAEDRSKEAKLETHKTDIAKPEQYVPQAFPNTKASSNSESFDDTAIEALKKQKGFLVDKKQEQELASINSKNKEKVPKPESLQEFHSKNTMVERPQVNAEKPIAEPVKIQKNETPKRPIRKEVSQIERPSANKKSTKPKIRFKLKKEKLKESLASAKLKSRDFQAEKPLLPQTVKEKSSDLVKRGSADVNPMDSAKFLDGKKKQPPKSSLAKPNLQKGQKDKLFKKSENLPKGMFEMFKSLESKIQLDLQKGNGQEGARDKEESE